MPGQDLFRIRYERDGPRSFGFSEGEVTIGRSRGCHIRIQERSVSRVHVKIAVQGGQVRLVDQGSTNGTRVNGVQIGEAVLRHGDRMTLGNFEASFEVTGEGEVETPGAQQDNEPATAAIELVEGTLRVARIRGAGSAAPLPPASSDLWDQLHPDAPQPDALGALDDFIRRAGANGVADLLAHPDERVREHAARLLARVDDAEILVAAILSLAEAVDDGAYGLLWLMTHCLARQREHPAVVSDAVERAGTAALPQLLLALRPARLDLAAPAVRILGEIRAPRSFECLAWFLRQELSDIVDGRRRERVRRVMWRAAAQTLATIDGERAVAALVEAARATGADENRFVQDLLASLLPLHARGLPEAVLRAVRSLRAPEVHRPPAVAIGSPAHLAEAELVRRGAAVSEPHEAGTALVPSTPGDPALTRALAEAAEQIAVGHDDKAARALRRIGLRHPGHPEVLERLHEIDLLRLDLRRLSPPFRWPAERHAFVLDDLARRYPRHVGVREALRRGNDPTVAPPTRNIEVGGPMAPTTTAWSRRVRPRGVRPALTLTGQNVSRAAMTPDGRIAVSGGGVTVTVWDLAKESAASVRENHRSEVTAVCVSPDGRWAVTGTAGWTLKVWDTASGECLRTLDAGGAVSFLAPDPSNRLFAVLRAKTQNEREHDQVHIWDVASGRCLASLPGHGATVTSVCWSADGRMLAAATDDRMLRLWDVAGKRCLRTFEGLVLGRSHPADAEKGPSRAPGRAQLGMSFGGRSAALSADGRRVLFGIGGVWDATIGAPLVISPEAPEVAALVLARDGGWALSDGPEGALMIWDVSSGAGWRIAGAHAGEVTSLSLSNDGRWALSAGADGTLRLWELDFETDAPEPADWDEGARPHLVNFLTLHTPPAPGDPLSRAGTPIWNEDDFQGLLSDLAAAAYGWLRPDGVRAKLDEMAREWSAPPPLPEPEPASILDLPWEV